jgi:hypothetical protein
MNNSLVILTPLYNDWGSLKILIKNIKKLNLQKKITLIIINDNSTKKSQILFKKDRSIIKIEIINLKENCGSQRAIAIGLNYLKIKKYNSPIIIIDSDGEDNPNLIKKMLEYSKKYKNYIITINRTFRTENFLIKILYELNIFFTILLTGKFIRFGNYSLIPNKIISKMNVSRDFWFSYPSAISNNYNNIKRIFAKKEKRYSGKSQMNYYQLIYHSLRIISTFKKRVFFNTLIYLTLIILFFMNNKTIIIISLIFFFLINIFFLYLYKFILRSKPDNYLCKIKNIKVINLI